MTVAPFMAQWTDDGTMEPLSRFKRACDASFVVGELYKIDCIEDRSAKSHSHYFARLHDLWMSLPESDAERWASVEHLRKWALVKCGYHDERSIVCASKAEAQRIAAFIKPMDGFAIVTVAEAVIRVWTAKSQSLKAMGRPDFEASKQAVLALIESTIGVEPGQGEAAA